MKLTADEKQYVDDDGVHRVEIGNGVFTIVDKNDRELVEKFKWSVGAGGYAGRKDYSNGGKYVSLHRYIMQPPSDMLVDHINRDPLDNRRCNLRICTKAENCRNQGHHQCNTSGYRGVTWSKQKKKWCVQIIRDYKHYHGGCYSDKEEAARVYDSLALGLHGEYARLNFPDETVPM